MKLKFELTARELMEVSNALAECCRNDAEWTKIKDKRIRKLFAENCERRHKLWLKFTHLSNKTFYNLRKKRWEYVKEKKG